MAFDIVSYIIGEKGGYGKGYEQGLEDGSGDIVIESGITCTDDGNGNITITEDN